MKSTITFKTKKELTSITFIRDIAIEIKGKHIHINPILDEYAKYINIEAIQGDLEIRFDNYFISSIPGRITLDTNLCVECTERSCYKTWTFYEETEETIELTSYEQGCAVLSDIFTPMG